MGRYDFSLSQLSANDADPCNYEQETLAYHKQVADNAATKLTDHVSDGAHSRCVPGDPSRNGHLKKPQGWIKYHARSFEVIKDRLENKKRARLTAARLFEWVVYMALSQTTAGRPVCYSVQHVMAEELKW